MAIIVKNFDSYGMKYWSLKEPDGVDRALASINCNDGNVVVGYLNFQDFYPLDENSHTNNIITMHFHISRLNDVIGFLRYETPLQLWFDDTKNGGRIQTISHEPVGEQEQI
jgi:hypothetical protein